MAHHSQEPDETLRKDRRDLYRALEAIIRCNAQGVAIGHEHIVTGRRVLARVSGRAGKQIDWTKERAAKALREESKSEDVK